MLNAGGIKRDNQLELIDNHSAFGRSRVALGAFDTRKEAINFYQYMDCYIIRYCFMLVDEALTTLGLKVPDMGDYTDDNELIDYSNDIDQQLIKLLGLNFDEYDFIKKTIDSRRGVD